jgi:tripartite-type tricarboxylate transporter receptor subunit TctC
MPELKPFDVSTWFGVFLPAATPKPVDRRVQRQMKSWLDDPKTKERFTTMAGFPAYGTPRSSTSSSTSQIALWKGVIDKEGLQLDVN